MAQITIDYQEYLDLLEQKRTLQTMIEQKEEEAILIKIENRFEVPYFIKVAKQNTEKLKQIAERLNERTEHHENYIDMINQLTKQVEHLQTELEQCKEKRRFKIF
jgi:hypothetical protein